MFPRPPALGASFARVGDELIVFGGASSRPLGDTWKVSISGDVGFGFWDPETRSATCGFGNTTMAVYADWTTFGPR